MIVISPCSDTINIFNAHLWMMPTLFIKFHQNPPLCGSGGAIIVETKFCKGTFIHGLVKKTQFVNGNFHFQLEHNFMKA